ncbi:MAG: histidine phosphatase family protein [Deltaproteobacteria bacterium]|nr:histidine phosphatase family protein [Deltaproteobacteria bacterium]
MSTLEVCLVRHGQSVSNAEGVWQGQGDSPLSDLGRTQVKALGAAILEEQYDMVLSSDLSRAADTAKAAGVEVEHDAAWREIHVGDWEGLTMEQVVERFPEQIAALKDRRTFAIGGGESWPEVFRRADASLQTLRQRMPEGGRAIVFTHGGIIAALLSGLLGVRDRFPWPLGRMRNTGRTTLRFSGGQVELVAHNDDSHVPMDLQQAYEPRADQVVVHLTSISTDNAATDTATTDFNSAIKSARNAGAGGVVSVSGTSHQIAELAQATSGASTREFRFLAPPKGRSSRLLISESHQMLLDYGLPIVQI